MSVTTSAADDLASLRKQVTSVRKCVKSARWRVRYPEKKTHPEPFLTEALKVLTDADERLDRLEAALRPVTETGKSVSLVIEERGQRHDLPVAVFTDRQDLLSWLEQRRTEAVAARAAALKVPPSGKFDDIPSYATLMVWQLREGFPGESKLLGHPYKVLEEADSMPESKSWDADHPGCAPETCGGSTPDPCDTVLRTRGRWHDGEVPETVAHAIEDALADEWDRVEAAPRIAAVVADWLRTRTSPSLTGDPFMLASSWAANLLDGRKR